MTPREKELTEALKRCLIDLELTDKGDNSEGAYMARQALAKN